MLCRRELLSHTARRRAQFVVSAALIASGSQFALAQSGSWNGSVDGSWNNSANWVGGVIPGNTLGSAGASTDTAHFDDPATIIAIVVDPNRNIQNISFNNGTQTFSIGPNGGNTLYLSSGGSVEVTSAVAAATS